jgi:hypothetical protein
MPKVRALQERPFYLTSEVIVAVVADDSTREGVFCIAQCLRNNMLDASTVG